MEQTKMNYPAFIELPIIQHIGTKDNATKVKSIVKVNPVSVIYFYPILGNDTGKDTGLTYVYVGGEGFWVDMPYEEFDEFWEDTKRSFNVEEPLY